MSESPDPADQLADLWERMRPVAIARLDAVIAVITDAAAGQELVEDRRAEAESAAHRLVGALEMYGYPWTTPILREAEAILISLGSGEPEAVSPALAEELQRVRRAVA